MMVCRLARGFSVSKGWTVNPRGCGVSLLLNFIQNTSVRCFDQTWLRKDTDIIGDRRGRVN